MMFGNIHGLQMSSVCESGMMIIQESDAGILGKKKSECSYQESNLRPSDY